MKSLKELYKIGRGPSSSHTMGPSQAAAFFLSKNPEADCFEAYLYGSLAKTGRGHLTDFAIKQTFAPVPCIVYFDTEKNDLPHPNTMELVSFKNGKELERRRVISVGGGAVEIEGADFNEPEEVYSINKCSDIIEYCIKNDKRIWEYVFEAEGNGIIDYLENIWQTMKKSVLDGLNSEGVVPGGLEIEKKAKYLFKQHHMDESTETRENRLVCAYAFAVSEQNACGETIVTAPTCGSAGVLPAVLMYEQKIRGFTDNDIVKALATGGIIGNLIKTNASISGAECGCQAEIGSACSMAAAALAELFEMDFGQIEYASEVAMEHHLGLTCDPVRGLVQIPCIERNAVAAMRAINAVSLANFLSRSRKVSFDLIVKTMYETGCDLRRPYRETGEGGLAKLYVK